MQALEVVAQRVAVGSKHGLLLPQQASLSCPPCCSYAPRRLAAATKSAAKTKLTSLLVSYTPLAPLEIEAAYGCPNGLEAHARGCPATSGDAFLLLPLRRAGQVKMWSLQGALVL